MTTDKRRDEQARSGRFAFYDVEGTLLSGNLLHSYAFYARHDPFILKRAGRLLRLGLSTPAYFFIDQADRSIFNRMFFRNYEGLSEDRLRVLSGKLFDTVLRPRLREAAVEILARNREAGLDPVLVTGAPRFAMEPLADYLGVKDFAAVDLVFRAGKATGEVRGNVLAGPEKAAWMQDYGRRNGVDLGNCLAYADSYSDVPMLSAVGRPFAVNPDWRLRMIARSRQWPVIDLDGGHD